MSYIRTKSFYNIDASVAMTQVKYLATLYQYVCGLTGRPRYPILA